MHIRPRRVAYLAPPKVPHTTKAGLSALFKTATATKCPICTARGGVSDARQVQAGAWQVTIPSWYSMPMGICLILENAINWAEHRAHADKTRAQDSGDGIGAGQIKNWAAPSGHVRQLPVPEPGMRSSTVVLCSAIRGIWEMAVVELRV